MNDGWSEATRRATREVLDEKAALPARDWIAMKRFEASGEAEFGRIALGDWLAGWPVTVTDGTGRAETFDTCDALLAAGWAVD